MRFVIYLMLLFSTQDINYRTIFNENYDKAVQFMDESNYFIEMSLSGSTQIT